MIGRTLDRYRIESLLGEGGMGVVYKARDTRLDRVVAIKVLPPGMVANPDRRQRFVQEARAASALNHPNIVTVHDVRSDEGIDFIVMEYAEGLTLDRVIPPKGLDVRRALRYAVQVADALARAHEAGIVHRDLKPSNLIVTPDERVKVLDFGVAKLIDPIEAGAETATRGAPVTDIGVAVGTAAYMSPEQAEGKPVDGRSDVFSFGVVLYEMVTGRKPFAAESSLGVLSKILHDNPAPPRTMTSDLPPDVERAILRCLRKDPARRYQTMADLKVALDDLIVDSSPATTVERERVRSSSRLPWVVAGVLPLVAVAAWIGWSWLSSAPAAPAEALRAVPLTAVPGVKRFPSFSPDGNHVTFTWTGPAQDNTDVYVQQIGAGTPLRITTDAAADSAPVWSPDGRAIAFLRQMPEPRLQEIRLVPPLGGPERKLGEIRPRGFLRSVTMAWCPDSSCLIVTDSQGGDEADALFVVSVQTGEKRLLIEPPPGTLADTDPAISPDGAWLAFRRDVAPFSGRLQVAALASDVTVRGEARPLTSVLLTAYGPRWISSDEIVFFAKSALWRMRMTAGSAAEMLPIGEDGIQPAVAGPRPDGSRRLVYARSHADVNVWRLDVPAPGAAATGAPVLAIASTRTDSLAQVSPDSKRLVFVSNRSGESEIWTSDLAGDDAVQLTSLGANPGYPRWSSDSRTVAFHSNAEDRPTGDVYLVPAGGGAVRNLTSHDANDVFPSFSRDGRSVYFSSTREGAAVPWRVTVSGGDAVKLTTTTALLSVESRDGASLFYVEGTTTGSPGALWRLPLGGGAPAKLADGALVGSFDVTEAGVYYLERVGGEVRLMFYAFASGRATLVAVNLGRVTTGLSASPDGRMVFFSRVDSTIEDLMIVERFR